MLARTAALGATASCLLLLLVAPVPAAAVRTMGTADAGADPTAPLVALLSLLAWLLAAWLLTTAALTAAGHLPGPGGRGAAAVARRTAPATVRRAVEVALGLSVAVGALGAAPAAAVAGPAPAPTPQQAPPLDWGSRAPEPTPPAHDLDLAADFHRGVAAPPAPEPAGVVVVRPGDSLWVLAEQDLAARGASTSDAAVARAWPGWWAANREVIGDDPDLIRPGTRLAPPPADGSAPAGPAST